MKIDNALRCFGTPDFEQEFFAELLDMENDLPLADFCSSSTPANDPATKLKDLRLDPPQGDTVTGTFQVAFNEYIYRGCRDWESNDRITGTIKFALSLNTGEITFEADNGPHREYEQEEF